MSATVARQRRIKKLRPVAALQGAVTAAKYQIPEVRRCHLYGRAARRSLGSGSSKVRPGGSYLGGWRQRRRPGRRRRQRPRRHRRWRAVSYAGLKGWDGSTRKQDEKVFKIKPRMIIKKLKSRKKIVLDDV